MLRATAVIVALAATAQAAEWKDLTGDCSSINSFKTLSTCAEDLFTARPAHILVESTVPGGGTALGVTYTHRFDRGRWQREFTAKGGSSFRGYWLGSAQAVALHPKFGGEWNTARDSFQLTIYGTARGMPRMPFYGLGPNSTQAGLADFSRRDTAIGATVFNPLKSWLAVGGRVEGLWPNVGSVASPSVVSIEQRYDEASAPGLLSQPAFIHSEFFLQPRHAAPFEFVYRIGYNYFTDTDSGRYSFGRFRADARHNFYPERTNGHLRRDSVLSFHGLVSTSSGDVPFYMQETLGGSDIDGNPALRGYRDYRFRGRDLLLMQVEADRRIKGPIGLMAFFDTGKVAERAGDLDLHNLRHSFGFGVTFWAASKVVFRAYVGLGSGEGYHPYFGIPTGL